jgi:hypothetical protein
MQLVTRLLQLQEDARRFQKNEMATRLLRREQTVAQSIASLPSKEIPAVFKAMVETLAATSGLVPPVSMTVEDGIRYVLEAVEARVKQAVETNTNTYCYHASSTIPPQLLVSMLEASALMKELVYQATTHNASKH